MHRALVDPVNWRLLKWLDEPRPFFDWHAREKGEQSVHPDDAIQMARMTMEFSNGSTSAVLRLRANDGGWTPVHVTINRFELEPDTFAGLLSLRLPTETELELVHFADDDDDSDEEPSTEKKARKGKKRKKDKHKKGKGRLASVVSVAVEQRLRTPPPSPRIATATRRPTAGRWPAANDGPPLAMRAGSTPSQRWVEIATAAT